MVPIKPAYALSLGVLVKVSLRHAVIASVSEAIQFFDESWDEGWIASSLALLAMTKQ
jgi:hypothetical protein